MFFLKAHTVLELEFDIALFRYCYGDYDRERNNITIAIIDMTEKIAVHEKGVIQNGTVCPIVPLAREDITNLSQSQQVVPNKY